jgi:hypothetical protein
VHATKALWGSGCSTSFILILSIRWRRVVSSMPWLLYLQTKSPRTHWIGDWTLQWREKLCASAIPQL